MRCTRCNRSLKNASPNGMGPKCAAAMLGAKVKRQRAEKQRDESTPDLFERERDIATAVHALIGGVSLEMPQ
jgi:hypothetical protein